MIYIPTSASALVLDGRDTSHLHPVNVIREFQGCHVGKHGVALRRQAFFNDFRTNRRVFAELEMGGKFLFGQVREFIVAQGKGNTLFDIVFFDAFCRLFGK